MCTIFVVENLYESALTTQITTSISTPSCVCVSNLVFYVYGMLL